MSILMDRPPNTYLLIVCCFTFVCVYGRGQDLLPPCEVEVLVRRGTTWKTAPQQSLTVHCRIKLCGEAVNVTWCKILDRCEQINYTDNITIRQDDNPSKDEMFSYLTFKRISIHDDGLYRCLLNGYKPEPISHSINISVSESHQGFENTDNNSDELPSPVGVDDKSWVPYFLICVGMFLLVFTLTMLTLLSFYGWTRMLPCKFTKRKDVSTHMIPGLPKGCGSSTDVLQANFSILNDIYSPSAVEKPTSKAPVITSGNLPVEANAAGQSKVTDRAVYAVINRQQPGLPARKQHSPTKQNENTEYATIKVA